MTGRAMRARDSLATLLSVQSLDRRLAELESRRDEIPNVKADVSREITALEQERAVVVGTHVNVQPPLVDERRLRRAEARGAVLEARAEVVAPDRPAARCFEGRQHSRDSEREDPPVRDDGCGLRPLAVAGRRRVHLVGHR